MKFVLTPNNHTWIKMQIYFLLSIIALGYCNWESEWLLPIKDTYRNTAGNAPEEVNIKIPDNFNESPGITGSPEDGSSLDSLKKNNVLYRVMSGESTSTSLTQKLKNTLQNAKALAETLKNQITSIILREKMLKEIIVTGSSGVTVLTVLLLGKLPRTYFIRDGFWTLCNGIVQYPTNGQGSSDIFSDLFAAPRCIGQEVTTRQDPCVFNSIIKYETIPQQRKTVYSEDEYLCLKSNFNQTLEQYLSVPKHIVNETCRDGTVRQLADNFQQCGLRVMSEYTYYPHKNSGNVYIPLEYCIEKDGACKLIMAWHISNTSIESFEFIKNDKGFKNFFMNTGVHSRSN